MAPQVQLVMTEVHQQRWEEAYRLYQAASQAVKDAGRSDRHSAEVLASASWVTAESWRVIAAEAGLPWCVLAAVEMAAEALEQQAWDWSEWSKSDASAER